MPKVHDVTSVPAVPKMPEVSDELQPEHLRHPRHSSHPRHPADSYSPQLDGLRAVAVLAVAWSHWERPFQFGIPFGAGVHLFYVLSGFLITRILLDLRTEADRMRALRAFYIRRALRIFPAFYLTLALAWLANVEPVRETLSRVMPFAAIPLAGWIVLLFVETAGIALPLSLVAIKQTLQALVFGWLVFRAADGFEGGVGSVLSARPVVYIGRISYGIYLAHGFAGDILASIGVSSRAIPEPWRFLILASLTVSVAAVSWHVLERPMNQLKRHFPYAGHRPIARLSDRAIALSD